MGLTIPPLKHFGPLPRRLGRARWSCSSSSATSARRSCSSAPSWRSSTSRPTAFPTSSIGLVLFLAGAVVLRRHRRPRPGPRRHLDRPVRRTDAGRDGRPAQITLRALHPGRGRPLRPGHRRVLAQAARARSRPSAEACDGETFPFCGSILPEPHTDFIFAVIVAELGRFRRLRADRDLRVDRITRLQDRGDGA